MDQEMEDELATIRWLLVGIAGILTGMWTTAIAAMAATGVF